jgi:hypothetical protein
MASHVPDTVLRTVARMLPERSWPGPWGVRAFTTHEVMLWVI